MEADGRMHTQPKQEVMVAEGCIQTQHPTEAALLIWRTPEIKHGVSDVTCMAHSDASGRPAGDCGKVKPASQGAYVIQLQLSFALW